MIYGLYLLIFLPWLGNYLEVGQFLSPFPGILMDILISVVTLIGVYVFVRQHRKVQTQVEEIQQLAGTDVLTGLGNVSSLQESLVREVARARRTDRPLSCLLLDLNDFQLINDQYGHEKGNKVLQVVAATIRGVIRHETDRTFRSGSDEFMIILPEAETQQVLSVAQRLQEAFLALKPPVIPKRSLPVNIGYVQLNEQHRAEDLLRVLNHAVSKAKTQGKNVIFDAQQLEP